MSALTWAVAAVVTDDTGRVLLCQQGRGARRYALPGGRLRPAEGPVRAALRDIRAETGWDIELVDLVGVYHLTGPPGEAAAGRAGPLPDVLVHVFRARAAGVRPAADPPAGCRLSWHSPDALPEWSPRSPGPPSADATAGRSGVLRDVPWVPDADGQRPGTGQDGLPGAAQPPEQRGEAADASLHP